MLTKALRKDFLFSQEMKVGIKTQSERVQKEEHNEVQMRSAFKETDRTRILCISASAKHELF